YWQPYTTTLAPSPDQAYLMLSIGPSDLSVLGNSLTVPPISASDVTVTLPDGTTTATRYNAGASQGNDLFDGLYWAQVPADVPSVKVTVNLPAASPMTAGVYQSGSQTLNISFASPVSTELTLPAAWTPPGGQFSIAHGPTALHLGKRGGFPWAALLIPLALVALAAGLILERRRRRWLPAREVVWPPKALPPATTALLMRTPPLALPPGQPASTGPGPQPPPPADTPEPATAGPMLVIRLVGDL
ncbi:MAG TPA: hypothetical protein VFH70_02110, partial [Acidimicrobiales bacterium]|nr:hypothetical protein [Acidimicrobiales bacterium]